MPTKTSISPDLKPAELAAWRGLLETHAALVSKLDAELEREHAMPVSSYEVLMILGETSGGRMRMGELANRVLLSRSGLTRLVDRLAKQDLVARERCEDDARGYFAVLTSGGRQRLSAVRPAHLAGVREHFVRPLSENDLKSLARIWAKLS